MSNAQRLTGVLFSACIFNLMLSAYLLATRPKIETIDLKILMNRYVQLLVKDGGETSKTNAKARMEYFNETITKEIIRISKKDRAVIMPTGAIYAGSEDKTDEIWQATINGMLHEK